MAQLASIRQMSGQVSRGSAGEYQADERAGVARLSSQSILKEITPEYSLEGLMLKLQYFGHLMRRTDSLEKTPVQGKTEGSMRRG